ncbi:MAG: sulfatase-like hydrolase/transferase [Oscillospiraceae bacterium]|nr:sulfatase-like hydrolase/transferase [Oscillospiraceae bacterium]
MNASKQTSKFKSSLTQLLPAYIISFVFCFMLFIFEPLLMYSTNQLDFWFDLRHMSLPMLVTFLVFFVVAAGVLTAVFAINKAIVKDKEPTFYRVFLLMFFLIFVSTYFQGNFLAGALPPLDGTMIDWSVFTTQNMITAAIWVSYAALIVIISVKFTVKKAVKIFTIATLVIFIMLTVSLLTEMISWNSFKSKSTIVATNNNFNKISTDKNFVIMLNDAVASVDFGEVLDENPEYKEIFEDFTYYPDTLGGYPCTRDSLPLILGGELNKNEKKFEDFASEAYNNSPLFNELAERGYTIDIYEPELVWYGNSSFDVKNSTVSGNYKMTLEMYFPQAAKYIKYKYLPYFLKKYSAIETMNFNGAVDNYVYDSRTIYSIINENPTLDKTDAASFKFIHTEGAHIPFGYDKDLNIIDGYTYYSVKVESNITLLKAWLERLKANGTYDNTVIIIMSDHGDTNLNSATDMLVRANPMFMIKGINEHHEFTVSQKPISYLDLMGIYTKLLDGATAEQSTAEIPDERERYFMWYRNFRLEHHMEEYVVKGKAWDWEEFEKTGREFDL